MTMFVLAAIVDTALLLVVALVVARLLRRQSAALRHAVLASAVVMCAVVPSLVLLVPKIPIVGPYTQALAVSTAPGPAIGETIPLPRQSDGSLPQTGPWPALNLLIVVAGLIWLTGAAVMAARLLTTLVRLARLRASCSPVSGRWRELTDDVRLECGVTRHVAVLETASPSLLMTCGVLRPAIVLPAGALEWDEDRIRAVLRHELAHIARGDAWLQIVAAVLGIFHWFNPLVGAARRRLAQESEYACDDAVLKSGVPPTEYAAHLLAIARQMARRPAAWPWAPAVADPSTLERRIIAMFDRSRNRAPLSGATALSIALTALVIAVPLAAAGVAPELPPVAAPVLTPAVNLPAPRGADGADLTTIELGGHRSNVNEEPRSTTPRRAAVTAAGGVSAAAEVSAVPPPDAAAVPQARAAITGVVVDQTGGVIPGVRLTIVDRAAGRQFWATTDSGGEFGIRDLPAGEYEIVAQLVAFATVHDVVTLAADSVVRRNVTMQLGSIAETVTVVCGAFGANGIVSPSLDRPGLIARIRASLFPVVEAQVPVRVGGIVRTPTKIKSVNPFCPANLPRGDTVVELRGVIEEDGLMQDVTAVRPASGEPVQSALDAVRQWKYTPVALNGRPIAVNVSVVVVFKSVVVVNK